MDIKAFLRSIPLSKGLSEDHLKKLAESARDRVYRSGQIIISEKDEIQGFFVLMRGKVKMFKRSIDGKEQILYL
nr:cyclic nucleotide-binding domain-containing protein [Deltaproteobacteria bacterium]